MCGGGVGERGASSIACRSGCSSWVAGSGSGVGMEGARSGSRALSFAYDFLSLALCIRSFFILITVIMLASKLSGGGSRNSCERVVEYLFFGGFRLGGCRGRL